MRDVPRSSPFARTTKGRFAPSLPAMTPRGDRPVRPTRACRSLARLIPSPSSPPPAPEQAKGRACPPTDSTPPSSAQTGRRSDLSWAPASLRAEKRPRTPARPSLHLGTGSCTGTGLWLVHGSSGGCSGLERASVPQQAFASCPARCAATRPERDGDDAPDTRPPREDNTKLRWYSEPSGTRSSTSRDAFAGLLPRSSSACDNARLANARQEARSSPRKFGQPQDERQDSEVPVTVRPLCGSSFACARTLYPCCFSLTAFPSPGQFSPSLHPGRRPSKIRDARRLAAPRPADSCEEMALLLAGVSKRRVVRADLSWPAV